MKAVEFHRIGLTNSSGHYKVYGEVGDMSVSATITNASMYDAYNDHVKDQVDESTCYTMDEIEECCCDLLLRAAQDRVTRSRGKIKHAGA